VRSTLLTDSFGRKLLLALQKNPRASIADLSRQIGLSPTRTAERFRRMEEVGIIEGYSVDLNREALGLPILAYVRLTCSGGRYKRFLEFVQDAEYVQECHHLTGGDAFLLKVAAVSMERLEKVIEMLLPFGDPTTSLVLSSPVRGRPLPVSGDNS
jgi:Lrp/AsnC family transcriptional regulator, leucine-responsive regulatory protein